MLKFCWQSLWTEYGRQFLVRVALPHPVKTLRAALYATGLDCGGGETTVGAPRLEPDRSIVGVGFCLKPLQPECPAGRFNHDCRFFEQEPPSDAGDISLPCRQCAIRMYGLAARRAGCAFYIMTSAHDILFDLFQPADDQGKFASGVFLLCRFSLKPFAVGMRVAGIQGWMYPFDEGDCRDYPTWLKADRGIKPEQTTLAASSRDAILALLKQHEAADHSDLVFEKRGNIFYPRLAGNAAEENINYCTHSVASI